MTLKKLVIALILITWPTSLFLNNTFPNFLHYLFPLDPKFAILPLLFLILNFKKSKTYLALIFLAFVIFVVLFKPFYGQTIFITNNDAKEELIQKGNLYNSIFLARLFQNK